MRDLDDVRRRLHRVEALVETVQRVADPSVRAATQELVEAVLDLHGAGLDRILEIVTGAADNGPAMLDRFSRDELVASLLLLHGLHPVDLDTRVRKAIETLVPTLRSQGGALELIRIEEGVVTVRLTRNGHGCSGSTALQQTIRSAFYEAAPDLERLEIDEVSSPVTVALVPLSSLRRNPVGSSPA
jgi:Fe-S cluster biogenesis protein NfuA